MMDMIFKYVLEMPFICGVIFMVVSAITAAFPPKSINAIYGYRTPSSMKSRERWDFAQKYSTRRMFVAGIGMTILSLVGTIAKGQVAAELAIGFAILFGAAAYILITTELALKKNFS